MLTLVSTIVKDNGNWENGSLSDSSLLSELTQFQDFRIVVNHTAQDRDYELRSENYQLQLADIGVSVTTLGELIGAITNTDRLNRKVTYLSQVRCMLNKCIYESIHTQTSFISSSVSEDQQSPDELLDTVKIVNDKEKQVLYPHLQNNCLVYIAGIIRPTSYTDDGFLIYHGGTSVEKGIGGNINYLDFGPIGGIVKHDVSKTNTHVKRILSEDPVSGKKDVTLELGIDLGSDILDRNGFMVIGGFPFFFNSFSVYDKTRIIVRLKITSIIERILKRPVSERTRYIPTDLRGVDIGKASSVVTFAVDHLLGMADTFFVSFDKSVCIKTETMTDSGLPGAFVHHRVPNGAIINDNGVLSHYNYREEGDEGTHVINVDMAPNQTMHATTDKVMSILLTNSDERPDYKNQVSARTVDFYKLND